MGTYILGGSNTNDDTGVLNAQGDVNALSDVIVTNDLTVSGTADITGDSTLSNASLSGTLSVTGDSTLASTTATSLTVSDTLTSPNINASTSPLDLQVAGSTVATLDSSGDLTTNGWAYIKGRNRVFQHNFTPYTTTSTTAVALGDSLSITPKFSGHIVITILVLVNNNTLGDGVYVSLTNSLGTFDGAQTYIQEGSTSNYFPIMYYYDITDQTIGTELTFTLNFNAVTGGTASALIFEFLAEEI